MAGPRTDVIAQVERQVLEVKLGYGVAQGAGTLHASVAITHYTTLEYTIIYDNILQYTISYYKRRLS